MTPEALLDRIDEAYCLDFLARMVQHKSYSATLKNANSPNTWPVRCRNWVWTRS